MDVALQKGCCDKSVNFLPFGLKQQLSKKRAQGGSAHV